MSLFGARGTAAGRSGLFGAARAYGSMGIGLTGRGGLDFARGDRAFFRLGAASGNAECGYSERHQSDDPDLQLAATRVALV